MIMHENCGGKPLSRQGAAALVEHGAEKVGAVARVTAGFVVAVPAIAAISEASR
jgi:hypothetical protein